MAIKYYIDNGQYPCLWIRKRGNEWHCLQDTDNPFFSHIKQVKAWGTEFKQIKSSEEFNYILESRIKYKLAPSEKSYIDFVRAIQKTFFYKEVLNE